MKKLLPTLSLLFFSVFINAQEKEIDSLEKLLEVNKKYDSIRLNILDKLSVNYSSYNAERGLELSNEGLALATALKHDKGIANAYMNMGYNYITLGDNSLALKSFQKAMDISQRNKNYSGVALALYGIGWVESSNSNYKQAVVTYQKAYDIFASLENTDKMAGISNAIGICEMYSGNYPKAIENYLNTLRLYETLGKSDSESYAVTLTNIGLVYNRMQENKLNLALEYYEKALNIFEDKGNKLQMANTLGNIANTYDNMNQHLKAVDLQKEAYNIFMELNNKIGIANTLTNIGIAYSSVNISESLTYLNKALPMYKELNNLYGETIVLTYLGKAILKTSNNSADLLTAENYLKIATYLSETNGYLQEQVDAHNLLGDLYFKTDNFKKAFDNKTKAYILNDSIKSQDFKDEITRLEVKYQYDKEAEIVRLEHEKKQAIAQTEIERQKLIKNGSIIGGSTLVFGILYGFFLYGRKRKAEFNAQVSDTELKALRAQMNPHFIFNSLNSINDFISKNDAASASNYLTKFAKVMRQILENSVENDISLEEDLKILDLYLQIEAMRLKNKFTYAIKVDDTIDTENTLVPPLILQPFIENSIWHGISKKESGGHIDISIKKEGSMLICTVDDNGVGRTLKTKDSSTGKKSLGISITKKRIDIINRRKNSNGAVKLTDKEQGVRVEVTLPLQLVF